VKVKGKAAKEWESSRKKVRESRNKTKRSLEGERGE
jgi:hypothetical protein